jgi:hypothetical protein
MIRLGMRLATAGGRGAVTGLALTALAVAVGVAILLFALSFAPAVTERDQRTAWRDTFPTVDDGAAATLVMVMMETVDERLLTRLHVAPAGDRPAAVPPALTSLPDPGTSYVSPALLDLIEGRPSDELGDRFGTVVGTVPESLLASPDELVAIVGTSAEMLRAQGAQGITGFATEAAPLDLPPIGALIVILAAIGALAPVAVFVATATRMSAARRELRLAALRLVGATPRQIARLAVVEALLATGVGSIGGVVLFLAARPLIARIPLDGLTWWPQTIMPPLPAALLLLVAVQLVGAAAALTAMRRLTITPLGVQRRASPAPPSAIRVVPLVVAVIGLALAVRWYRGDYSTLSLGAAGLAFAGVVVGIALVGPWLTALVGRSLHRVAGGASTLLAARRLGDEPRGSFGAIAGVIMAVFVASAFFTFVAYTDRQAEFRSDPLIPDGAVVAYLGTPMGDTTDDLVRRLGSIEGVTGVLPVREIGLVVGDGMEAYGWIVDCARFVEMTRIEGASCSPTGISTTAGVTIEGSFRLVPDRADGTGAIHPGIDLMIESGDTRPLLATDGMYAGHLAQVIVDPSAIGGATVAETFPATRFYVMTDGSPATPERIRTMAVAAVPNALVRQADERFAGDETFAEIGRIVAIGLIGTLALGGSSLAVAVTTATLERRRQFVFLRSAGMPASGLRSAILLQAGAPLVSVALFSALLGVVVGMTVLTIAGAEVVALPDPMLLVSLGLSLAAAMGIVSLTLPPLERMTRPTSIRHE